MIDDQAACDCSQHPTKAETSMKRREKRFLCCGLNENRLIVHGYIHAAGHSSEEKQRYRQLPCIDRQNGADQRASEADTRSLNYPVAADSGNQHTCYRHRDHRSCCSTQQDNAQYSRRQMKNRLRRWNTRNPGGNDQAVKKENG